MEADGYECGDLLRRKLLLSKIKRLKTLEKDPWWGGCGGGQFKGAWLFKVTF